MSATVIIPTTGSPELRKAIDSVLKQTYPTTCYVVSDGSLGSGPRLEFLWAPLEAPRFPEQEAGRTEKSETERDDGGPLTRELQDGLSVEVPGREHPTGDGHPQGGRDEDREQAHADEDRCDNSNGPFVTERHLLPPLGKVSYSFRLVKGFVNYFLLLDEHPDNALVD